MIDTVIYETHVRGFTVHPSASVAHPGTYLGLTEKIPYLQELGVTAVELLPVQEFFENELGRDEQGKQPVNSINFVTCHDGFTLNDLVCYRDKHNLANGEDNADGDSNNYSNNYSDNYGVEGLTDDAAIEVLRLRQIKNFISILLVSRGVPMLLGGDEFRRTRGGNNNAYCQDNETSWFDWELLQRHREVFRFTREMIALRKRHELLRQERFYTAAYIHWFDPRGEPPQWNGPGRTLGCVVNAQDRAEPALCLLSTPNRRRWGSYCSCLLPAVPGWSSLIPRRRRRGTSMFLATNQCWRSRVAIVWKIVHWRSCSVARCATLMSNS